MTCFLHSTKFDFSLVVVILLAPTLLFSSSAVSNQLDQAIAEADEIYDQNCKQRTIGFRAITNILQRPSTESRRCNESTKNQIRYQSLDLSYRGAAAGDSEYRKNYQQNSRATTDYGNLGPSDFTTRSFALPLSMDTNLNRIAQPIKTLQGFETVNGKQQ